MDVHISNFISSADVKPLGIVGNFVRNFPFYVSGVAISVYKPITLSPVNMVDRLETIFIIFPRAHG